VSKLSILPLAFAVAIGISFSASAGPQPVSGSPGPYNTEPITAAPASTPGTGATLDPVAAAPAVGARPDAQQKPDTSDASDTGNDNDDDPSLTRLGTTNSLARGSMSRDEGQLTAKPRRREKVLKVESTKQLPTSGTDPKFQGSLLHSSVTSIQDVGEKANAEEKANDEDKANDEEEVKDEGDPRFKAKRLVFSPSTENESKITKKKSPRTKADSSPSPSPSPNASATPSSH
jgi:hypothetical protein